MTQKELFQLLITEGLYPIPVNEGIDEQDATGLQFAGDTNGFIEAAKSLSIRCVFVATRKLTEDDFIYTGGPRRFNAPRHGIEEKKVKLVAIRPDFDEYKKHIGSDCGHRLWIGVDRTQLEHFIRFPWWDRFAKLREETIEIIEDEQENAWAKQGQTEQLQRDALLERLRALISDKQFVKLPRQITMLAYAVEQIPELKSLGDKLLKSEMQKLDAMIKARGLRGKS